MADYATRAGLDELAQEIRQHRGCGFEPCETCLNPVPGEGSPHADVVFVGEAPGAAEDKAGRPFVGSAGRLLDRLLEEAGLHREDVFITNVLKARPPDNRDPRAAEIEHSLPWLEAQLALIEPKLIVPLGRHALDALAPGHKITKVHGTLLRQGGRALYPTFHPAAALRVDRLRAALHEDFARLPETLAEARGAATAGTPTAATAAGGGGGPGARTRSAATGRTRGGRAG